MSSLKEGGRILKIGYDRIGSIPRQKCWHTNSGWLNKNYNGSLFKISIIFIDTKILRISESHHLKYKP